nr:glutathione S-transferase Mu 1-like [Parasteatoda tepidariorum]
MSQITLAYWDLRGLGEPIRYLLHYKNVKFEDKRYQDPDTWQKEKFTLGLDFPNLPYYIDDKVKLTQSFAILRYLAKVYDLEGETEEEKLRASLVEQQISDLRMFFFQKVAYTDSDEAQKEAFNAIPGMLKLYAEFLGRRKFLVSDNITYVDFLAYEAFDFCVLFSKTVLDDFPNLKAYHERIGNLPELQEYFSSSKRWPIVGKLAHWGGSGEMPE